MKTSLFMQTLLVILVLAASFYIRYRINNEACAVFSQNGSAVSQNLTLTDLAEHLYRH